jgi:hypothetical protein
VIENLETNSWRIDRASGWSSSLSNSLLAKWINEFTN